ncbi:MAG: class I SAM-dependent methyltransferase [Spirochaetes bacterium]|nr:class I SAM-dependent methyltransferase [Spirochaetota bacterium]
MNKEIIKLIIDQNKEFINNHEEKIKKSGENFSRVEYFGRMLLLNFFKQFGFFNKAGERIKIGEIRKKITILPKFYKLLDVLLIALKNEGFIKITNDVVETLDKIEKKQVIDNINDLREFKNNLIKEYQDMKPHFDLLEVAIDNYKSIFNGEKTADEVLFPLFSIDLVKNIFTNNILSDYFNEIVSLLILTYIKENQTDSDEKVKILEIGSGTGGTTFFVAKKLAQSSADAELFFTDISNVFVKKGKKLFSNDHSFMQFKQFDIEGSIEQYGFCENYFDVIFASNVIHSVKNIDDSLKNIHGLLKKNGILILNEVTKFQDFVNLTFGLMDKWWQFEDKEKRIENSPLLTIKSWMISLNDNNFKNIELVTSTHQDKKDSFSQSVIVCQK